MQDIYLISGLGADKKLFDFLDLSGYTLNHVHWIEPLLNENIEGYAHRLLEQIPTTKPTIIGVSFGGMIAIEIGKLVETEKLILVSSAKTRDDIPGIYKLIGRLKFHKLVPPTVVKRMNILMSWAFGTKDQRGREMLRAAMANTDNAFLRWAIDKIVNWKNEVELPNVTTIHGTRDRILPNNKVDFAVKGGGHLMIVDNAEEISLLVRSALERANSEISNR